MDCRIEPHAPPFIQTPANLFKFYLCSFTPQARYLRVSLYEKNTIFRTISIDSGHELLGSPILFDTRALAIRRQEVEWRAAAATEDPYNLSEFHL